MTGLEASRARSAEDLTVRSASLRNLAVWHKVDPDILHSAADMLYDVSIERDALLAENQRLREAIMELFALLDEGELVRNIERDSDHAAFMRQGLRIVSTLRSARAALASGKERAK